MFMDAKRRFLIFVTRVRASPQTDRVVFAMNFIVRIILLITVML